METYIPQPGDFFLTQITGFGGFLIRIAQAISGDASRYTHAGIVLDDGTVVQAMPGGATIVPLEDILGKKPLAFSYYEIDSQTRQDISDIGRSFEGTPYNFLNYLMLGFLALGIRPPRLRKAVHSSKKMICSQLVDRVYNLAGVQLFDDGRDSGDVTPGDLAHVGTIHHITSGPKTLDLPKIYPM